MPPWSSCCTCLRGGGSGSIDLGNSARRPRSELVHGLGLLNPHHPRRATAAESSEKPCSARGHPPPARLLRGLRSCGTCIRCCGVQKKPSHPVRRRNKTGGTKGAACIAWQSPSSLTSLPTIRLWIDGHTNGKLLPRELHFDRGTTHRHTAN